MTLFFHIFAPITFCVGLNNQQSFTSNTASQSREFSVLTDAKRNHTVEGSDFENMENKNEEVWRDVVGYEGLYEVSNFGGIRGLRHKHGLRQLPKTRKSTLRCDGYFGCPLCKDGEYKHWMTHRIVATAFISNPDNKKEVNHIDFDRSNNRAENLEWVTPSENVRHTVKMGRHKTNAGEQQHLSKLKNEDVSLIRVLYDGGMGSVKIMVSYFPTISLSTICRVAKRETWKHI